MPLGSKGVKLAKTIDPVVVPTHSKMLKSWVTWMSWDHYGVDKIIKICYINYCPLKPKKGSKLWLKETAHVQIVQVRVLAVACREPGVWARWYPPAQRRNHCL